MHLCHMHLLDNKKKRLSFTHRASQSVSQSANQPVSQLGSIVVVLAKRIIKLVIHLFMNKIQIKMRFSRAYIQNNDILINSSLNVIIFWPLVLDFPCINIWSDDDRPTDRPCYYVSVYVYPSLYLMLRWVVGLITALSKYSVSHLSCCKIHIASRMKHKQYITHIHTSDMVDPMVWI